MTVAPKTSKVTPRVYKTRSKNKIQFSKLPTHLQQKYVELFRPKELQELLASGSSP